jgi:hypothetical protein
MVIAVGKCEDFSSSLIIKSLINFQFSSEVPFSCSANSFTLHTTKGVGIFPEDIPFYRLSAESHTETRQGQNADETD